MRLDPVQPHQRANKRKAGQAAEPVVAGEQSLNEVSAGLEEKLSHAKERQTAISRERKAISLAAHMGSADDRARLDQLNHEGAILSGEIESIETAIAHIKAQIAEAEAAAVREAERKKKDEIAELADGVRDHAERIDDLWRQSIAEYNALQAKLHEIAQGSGGRPALHVVQSACRRALISAFIGSPLQLQLLAPGERHKMADLVSSWLRNVGTDAALPLVNGKGAA